ncbi:zinc-dependent alcohol dehydrogenase family protein [Rhizobium jaguaris]|uniref:NADPH:quinone reductase n=1 Tax=Rhizobium jaguaris TaxID=1312183 RepID=A0A387FSY2_9HYPH|nr:zinc-dependent alcohol dehydrogenase family protein [Rhizobium jaguaris]AYG57936.1 NADPH:quinone reductase [Rhizobium jaguaris]
MSRVVRFHQVGGPDVLRIEDIEPMPPATGEVRITVKAIGINRADILMRSGTYIQTPTLPSGLGLEAAGVVDAVGAEVDGLSPGDVVSVIPPISMTRWPAYGEVAVFPAHHIVRHPPAIDFVTAAASWMQYLTAYGALIDIAGIAAGERVLITAASSSAGLAAIQIANGVGAIPIAVTRGYSKKQALLDAGAHDVIVADDDDFASNLLAASGRDGFRIVFDPVAGPAFMAIAAAMADGGMLIEYGGLSAQPTPFPVGSVLAKTLTLRGYLVHEIIRDPARLERAKTFILDGLSTGSLKPVIAKVFSFDQIAQAHAFLERNEHLGKVVVTV